MGKVLVLKKRLLTVLMRIIQIFGYGTNPTEKLKETKSCFENYETTKKNINTKQFVC